MISLLMVAASLNAMAVVTYTGKAKLTLTSADNKSCTMTIGESADLNAGINNGYYAILNEEGREVMLYVEYGGKKYQQFASNAATMQDLQLGIVTNASTTYTLTAANVTGSLRVKINGVEYTIDAAGTIFSDVTLPASSTLPAAGDEDKYKVQPSAPAAPSICFSNNQLDVIGYAGKNLSVKKTDGTDVIAEQVLASDAEHFDLKTLVPADTRLVVTLDGTAYQIDVNPTVTLYTPVVP